MEAKAILRTARISPQKARLVADQVRGLSAERAVNLLKFSDKKAAHLIKKVVESAIANAENMPRHASGKKSEPYLSRASNVDAAPAASGRRNKWAERGTHATGASINEITQTTRNMPLATISSDVVSLRGTRWRANIPTAINPTNTSDRSPRPKWR